MRGIPSIFHRVRKKQKQVLRNSAQRSGHSCPSGKLVRRIGIGSRGIRGGLRLHQRRRAKGGHRLGRARASAKADTYRAHSTSREGNGRRCHCASLIKKSRCCVLGMTRIAVSDAPHDELLVESVTRDRSSVYLAADSPRWSDSVYSL
jgi:hypothetical protein